MSRHIEESVGSPTAPIAQTLAESESILPLPEASPSSPPLSPLPAELPSIQPITDDATIPAPSAGPSTRAPTSLSATAPAKLPIPATRIKARTKSTNGLSSGVDIPNPPAMGITESIASAPAPRPTDFSYDPNAADYEIDIEAALERAARDEDMPGSPTSKIMKAIAPPQAGMADVKWPTVSFYFWFVGVNVGLEYGGRGWWRR